MSLFPKTVRITSLLTFLIKEALSIDLTDDRIQILDKEDFLVESLVSN